VTDIHAKNWDNYWQGRASQKSGNALIEVGIERNHELKKFWNDFFTHEDKSSKVIDFACGAGSVLEHASHLGFSNLTGLDVSQKALDVMTQKHAGINTVCAAVNQTGLDNNSYDIAVSQFGIEYAGDKSDIYEAFSEMLRILKPSGKLVAITHSVNGVIMEGCQASLNQINLIEECKFIEASQQVLSALHDPAGPVKGTKFNELTQKLNESAKPIMQWLESFQDLEAEKTKNEFTRFAYHLLESSHRLITHHNNYTQQDSKSWFDGMELELQAYKGRMLSMTKAALSHQDIIDLQDQLKSKPGSSKVNFEKAETLHFNSNSKPAAWVIRAQKL